MIIDIIRNKALVSILILAMSPAVFLAKPIVLSMSEKTFVRLELSAVAFAGGRVMYMGMKAA